MVKSGGAGVAELEICVLELLDLHYSSCLCMLKNVLGFKNSRVLESYVL